jgi:hypothetical protein
MGNKRGALKPEEIVTVPVTLILRETSSMRGVAVTRRRAMQPSLGATPSPIAPLCPPRFWIAGLPLPGRYSYRHKLSHGIPSPFPSSCFTPHSVRKYRASLQSTISLQKRFSPQRLEALAERVGGFAAICVRSGCR